MRSIKQPLCPVLLSDLPGPMWVAIYFLLKAFLSEGKGELKLTGNLGNVMKESATTALTYLTGQCKKI